MLRFHRDGTFRVMQITDIQEVPAISPDTLKFLEAALKAESPDLVLLTGDQIKGYGVTYKGKGDALCEAVSVVLRKLLKPVSDRGIPFAVTFGNHDPQVGISNREQTDKIYRKIPGFIAGENPGPKAGTAQYPVYSADGEKIALNFYLLDSGTDAGGGYEPVAKDLIAWYRETRDRLRAQTGEYVPSMVFQHIPPREVYDILQQVPKGTKGAVRAWRTHKNEYYIPGKACNEGAVLLEPPSVPDENTGEFEAFCEKGDVFGLYFGHDHKNNLVGNKSGIDLGYTPSSGFSEYGNGVFRGVRVFDFKEENPKAYETRVVTFADLCKGGLQKPFRDFLQRHAPTCIDAAIPMILGGVGILASLVLLILLLVKFL